MAGESVPSFGPGRDGFADIGGAVTCGITSHCSRRLTLSQPWLAPSPRQPQSLLSPSVSLLERVTIRMKCRQAFAGTLVALSAVLVNATEPNQREIAEQVREGVGMAAAIRAAVSETILNGHGVPVDRKAAGLSESASDAHSKYVSSVDVSNGLVIVVFGGEASEEISGKTLVYTPYENEDLAITWLCGGAPVDPEFVEVGARQGAPVGHVGSTLPEEYLPEQCKEDN